MIIMIITLKLKTAEIWNNCVKKNNSINPFYLLLNTRYLVFSKFKRHCVTYITSHINNSKKHRRIKSINYKLENEVSYLMII